MFGTFICKISTPGSQTMGQGIVDGTLFLNCLFLYEKP